MKIVTMHLRIIQLQTKHWSGARVFAGNGYLDIYTGGQP